MNSHACIFVLFALVKVMDSANILFLNGAPSLSHHIFNRVLVLELAAKGHNVTFLSPDISERETTNVHYIHLEKAYERMYQGDEPMNLMDLAEQGPIGSLIDIAISSVNICKGILASSGLETLLSYPEDFKFDVIVFDFSFGPCLLPLIARFNYPPVVAETAFANPPFTVNYVGGHKYPAYVPHYSVTYQRKMSLFQRLCNTGIYSFDFLMHEVIIFAKAEKLVRERFKFRFPSLKELAQRTAIVLVNTDNAIDFPQPLEPNMIQVGGLQIVDTKPLPQEMDDFIKSGKKGTVLMSLGTNMKSNMLGDERLKVILGTFAQLPEYNFLWKFESEADELPVKPTKNVMLSKFLPQNDILAHPKIVAFVTHSGMLSTHEAFWHGKPVIAIPFFLDQVMNSIKAVNLGVGVKVDYKKLTIESFKSSIESVVKNPKYLENSKRVSKLFRDKPDRPLDRAIWWIEYVIRNPQIDNLISPTIPLGPFISNSYDVLLVVLLFLLLVYFSIAKIIRTLLELRLMRMKRKND